MKVKEATKKEIEDRINIMGDYVKIEYLSNCLKNALDYDTRKFVLVKLAGLFESKGMLWDAGKTMRAAAEINTTSQNKIMDYVKAAELFIRAGNFDELDLVEKRAFGIANERQREEIKNKLKEVCKLWAKHYLKTDKRKNAMIMYEKLMTLELNEAERIDAVDNLLNLYSSLGKIREYNRLKGMNKNKE